MATKEPAGETEFEVSCGCDGMNWARQGTNTLSACCEPRSVARCVTVMHRQTSTLFVLTFFFSPKFQPTYKVAELQLSVFMRTGKALYQQVLLVRSSTTTLHDCGGRMVVSLCTILGPLSSWAGERSKRERNCTIFFEREHLSIRDSASTLHGLCWHVLC